MSQRELETLSEAECLQLLSQQAVGRFVYSDGTGPLAEPVNYVLADDSLLFRIEGGAKQDAISQPATGFEVDCIDAQEMSGWSVVARGACQEVPVDEVPALLHRLRRSGTAPPHPWASGVHNVWVRFSISAVSGRRLAGESTPLAI